jgi:hypothetical protein
VVSVLFGQAFEDLSIGQRLKTQRLVNSVRENLDLLSKSLALCGLGVIPQKYQFPSR